MDKSTHELQPAELQALSRNIASDQTLYWELAPNPYSSNSVKIISERFPEFQTSDIIRAIVLAEPEGEYDRNFKLLGAEQQSEALRNQEDITTEITNRLAHYYKKHEKELNRLSKSIVYDNLSQVVFGTTDAHELEQVYAQSQRSGFRLSIVNCIETQVHATESELPGKKVTSVVPSVIIFFSALSFIFLFYIISALYTKEEPKQTLGVVDHVDSEALPIRLKIPKINVDSAIEYVGITPQGAMDVPTDASTVGWFHIGPRPGEKGSAVIAGHFDGENGQAGVFAKLNKLREGDKVFVEYQKGMSVTFVVRERRMFDPGYAEEVFSKNDMAHLNLITCDGIWDAAKKSYSKRLIVFTDITPLTLNQISY